MKTINTISRYACFVWLWRNDPEYKWGWLEYYLRGYDLRDDVKINLSDFGLTKGRK